MHIFNFFTKKNKLDEKKVKANVFVLQQGSFELAKLYAGFDENQEQLLKFATESIKKIDPMGGIPMGFTLEFVASYPDVVLWWKDLSDEKQEDLFKNIDEKDVLDDSGKIKEKYTKIITDSFKAAGFDFECGSDKN